MAMILLVDAVRKDDGIALISAKIKKEKVIMILLAGYAVLTIISGFLAHDRRAAFAGGLAQHESVLVVTGYIIICLFSYCYLKNIDTLVFVHGLFLVGAAIISIIGIMQLIGQDIFMSDIGKRIITTFSDIDPDRITLKFDPGIVYMTLYNPDYTGSYVALVLPFTAAGILISKKMAVKILSAVISIMLLICLVGSQSRTGFIAIGAAVVLFVIMLIKKPVVRNIVIIASLACAVLAGVFYMNVLSAKDDFAIDYMNVSEEGALIRYKGEDIVISTYPDEAGNELLYMDKGGESISTPYDELNVSLKDYDNGEHGFNVFCRGISLDFVKANGTYYYRNVYGNDIPGKDIHNSERLGFPEHDRLGNGRGYIWSRSIPLLFRYPVIGCGQDNFIYAFPNDDYLSLLNNDYSSQIVTRPHNLYLQTGVQSGLASLILFLGVYVIYFIKGLKLYAGNFRKTKAYIAGLSIYIGIAGYMVAGLANDSTVCVAPVFWVLLGTGFAVNHMVSKSNR